MVEVTWNDNRREVFEGNHTDLLGDFIQLSTVKDGEEKKTHSLLNAGIVKSIKLLKDQPPQQKKEKK